MAERPRVMIGLLPERNGVPSADILFDLLAIAQQGYAFARVPYTRTDLARNSLAEHLLKEARYTHILMLDADHRHPVDIVRRLMRWVIEDPQRLVIAGLAFRRGPPYDPCMYFETNNGKVFVPESWKPGLVQVDLAGTGAILIAREVFERVKRPWFAYDYSWADSNNYPGEDIWFSRRCREAGIPIYVDTSTVSPHLIEQHVDESTYRSYLEMALAAQEQAARRPQTEDDLRA